MRPRGSCTIAYLVLCLALLACSRSEPRTAERLRIAGGPRDATFFILANAIASVYARRLPELVAEGLETGGTTENIDAVESGDAECGLGSADLVYNAYVRGTVRVSRPHTRLRGIAVLFPNALHLTTRGDSRLVTLADLAGKRIAAALPGDPSDITTNRAQSRLDAIVSAITTLARHQTPPETVAIGMDDAVGALEHGRIDAAEFYGGYPFRPVTEAAQRYRVHLVEFDDLASSLVKARYPFFKPIVIPADTYPGQTTQVQTIAIDNVLICRADLSTDLVYRLTLGLYEGLPSIASVHASARQINPENGAATPIPLHDGASRYYRERELFR